MAAKNGSAKRSKVPCGVCQAPVVDGKDEALLCEGDCGHWLHRGCASVPPNTYESLSTTDKPFVCLCCSNQQIALLRTDVNSLQVNSQYIDIVEALRTAKRSYDCVFRTGVASREQDSRETDLCF